MIMFNRKHHKAIAKVFYRAFPLSGTKTSKYHSRLHQDKILRLMTEMLAADNPRFKPDTFHNEANPKFRSK